MRGFTLLEMMLSVALLSLVFGMSYTLYTNVAYQNELDQAARSSQALLRKAALYSGAVNDDSQWGVRFMPTEAVLFKGGSYAARDTVYDEVVSLEGAATGGDLEYVFNKVSGEPEAPGITTLSNQATAESLQIIVNEKGLITVE